jgi:hypothetical protein
MRLFASSLIETKKKTLSQRPQEVFKDAVEWFKEKHGHEPDLEHSVVYITFKPGEYTQCTIQEDLSDDRP